jgi:hypothetical protein
LLTLRNRRGRRLESAEDLNPGGSAPSHQSPGIERPFAGNGTAGWFKEYRGINHLVLSMQAFAAG